MARLTNILIGGLFIAVIIVGITGFIGSGVGIYEPDGYNESALLMFNKSSYDISDIARNTANDVNSTIAGDTGAFDIFGSFFSTAWSSIKSVGNSVTTFTFMATQGVGLLPGMNPEFKATLIMFLVGSVIIIIFIGIFFHFIKSSDRL